VTRAPITTSGPRGDCPEDSLGTPLIGLGDIDPTPQRRLSNSASEPWRTRGKRVILKSGLVPITRDRPPATTITDHKSETPEYHRRIPLSLPRWSFKSPKWTNLGFLALLALVDFLILRTVINVSAFSSSDIQIPFFGGNQLRYAFFSGWNYQLGGAPNGSTFYLVGAGYFATLLGDPGTVEKLIYFSSVPASALAAYLMLSGWKLGSRFAAAFALLYQFSPWFVGEFMNGEPAFTWLYVFIPLLLWSLTSTARNPKGRWEYVVLATVLTIATAFTLQVVAVAVLLAIPLLVYASTINSRRDVLWLISGWVLALSSAVLVNLFSFSSYLDASSQLGTTYTTSGTAALLVGPPLQQYKLPLLILLGCVILMLLLPRTAGRGGDNKMRVMFYVLALENVALDAVYFALPAKWAGAALTTPILSPFVDIDKFLMFSWLTAFVGAVFYAKYNLFGLSSRDHGLEYNQHKDFPRASRLGMAFLIGRRCRRYLRPFVAVGVVGLLIATGMLVPLSPQPTTRVGYEYVAGSEVFGAGQIPQAYFDLRGFLEVEGGTFGLSFHTVIAPENPGVLVPTEVGMSMIPGFVPPSPILQQFSHAVAANESSILVSLALAGVRYIAIVPNPPDLQWTSVAESPPSSVQFLQGWIPVGNQSDYVRTLSSWTELSEAYESGGLIVYQDLLYQSPLLQYSNESIADAVAGGNDLAVRNITQIGPELIAGGNVTYSGNWSSNNGSAGVKLESNGTFELQAGPGGEVGQVVTFDEPGYYLLNFSLRSKPLDYPINSVSYFTHVALYWSANASIPVEPQWVSPNLTGLTEQASYLISIPNVSGSLVGHLFFYAAPPGDRGEISWVTFSNVSFHRVSGKYDFGNHFLASNVSSISSTSFQVELPIQSNTVTYLQMDTSYNSGWVASDGNMSSLPTQMGVYGQEVIVVPAHTHIVSIHYAPQGTYTTELIISLVSGAGLLILCLALGLVRIRRALSAMRERNSSPEDAP
jgi:hypothetical protein